jgi:hypothetical protein
MKKFRLKGVFILFTIVLLTILHLPVAFSGVRTANKELALPNDFQPFADSKATTDTRNGNSSLSMVYDSLNLDALGLSAEAFQYAVKGFEKLKQKGRLMNQNIISIVDFTKPSYQKRLFVIDLNRYKVLFNTYVAHGQNTGREWARNFSNTPESFQSSLGFYVTSGTYIGKNGFSMQLQGQESGFNDKAGDRAIVMHGAPYVSEGYIKSMGFIGRSHGCPAVPEKLNKPIINTIKNGSCLFIYSDNKSYLNRSRLINS